MKFAVVGVIVVVATFAAYLWIGEKKDWWCK